MTTLQKTFVGSIIAASIIALNVFTGDTVNAAAPVVTYTTEDDVVKISFDQPDVKIGNNNIEVNNFVTTFENATEDEKINIIKDLIIFEKPAYQAGFVSANINVNGIRVAQDAQSISIWFGNDVIKPAFFETIDTAGNNNGVFRMAFAINTAKFKSISGESDPGRTPIPGYIRLQFRARLDDDLNYLHGDSETRVIDQADFQAVKAATNKLTAAIAKVKADLLPKASITADENQAFIDLANEIDATNFAPEFARIISAVLSTKSIIAPALPAAPQVTQPAIKLPNTGFAKNSVSVMAVVAFVASVVAGIIVIKKQ